MAQKTKAYLERELEVVNKKYDDLIVKINKFTEKTVANYCDDAQNIIEEFYEETGIEAPLNTYYLKVAVIKALDTDGYFLNGADITDEMGNEIHYDLYTEEELLKELKDKLK